MPKTAKKQKTYESLMRNCRSCPVQPCLRQRQFTKPLRVGRKLPFCSNVSARRMQYQLSALRTGQI
jgi:hypothetical protein